MAGHRARNAAVWLVAVVVQVGRVQAEDGPSPPPPCTLSCGRHGSQSSLTQPCTCQCDSGWKGSTCDTGPCTRNCGSHGSRTSSYDDCICSCDDGWMGGTCSNPTGCNRNKNDCQNGATCVPDGGSHTCRCGSSWSGDTCGHPTGCDGNKNDCQNGATCVPDGGSRSCSCTRCYRGGTCGTPKGCDQANCHHGDCSVPSGDPCGHTCTCNKGFSGDDCNHDPCAGVDCHHGSCDRNDNGRGYTCSCNEGWTGSDCTSCKAAYTCPNKVPVAHSSSSCSDGTDESTCYRGPSCRATCDSCYNGDPTNSARFSCGTDSTATSAWDGSLT
jgi:hypothetical protein